MKAMSIRDGDRPAPRNRRWTPAEDAELERRLRAREPVGKVALAMRRTVDGIRGRAQLLRLTLPGRLRPWRPQVGAIMRRDPADVPGPGPEPEDA